MPMIDPWDHDSSNCINQNQGARSEKLYKQNLHYDNTRKYILSSSAEDKLFFQNDEAAEC